MNTWHSQAGIPARAHGLSLVELMISLVLGALVVGGAIGLFLSNRQAYSATESLGRVQENSRVAFELMSRDIREAAGNPCSANLPVANVVQGLPAGAAWAGTWNLGGVLGFNNGALAVSAPNTDAIELKSGGSSGINVTHSASTSEFTAVSGGDAFAAGDIALVCDYRQAAIFIVGAASATSITYNTGVRADGAANCQVGLGVGPNNCAASRLYSFQPSTMITKLRAARWYVADNGRGVGRSLYQSIDGGDAEEIVEGVRDMQIQYLERGGVTYTDATAATNWPNVTAVRITLNMEGGEGQERVGTDTAALRRTLFHVVTLRNHNS